MGTILVDHSKAEESISKTGKSAESLSSKIGAGLQSAAKIGAAGMIAIGTAAAGMAVKAVTASNECQKALNTLQAQTGATSDEMDGLKESMLSIYGQNYGESFEDVAQALAQVKQQTNLTGEALEEATTNALTLRDTFDWEVEESVRAADMMVKQFGISTEEAYNLLAQGAQNGLDKNQNLLDSVNEYSVHFKQLGLDAEDMFNMFSNGAQTGVFDIDKLGDAVKEFGIRVKDGTADEAFEQLGLNAEQLKQAFAEGGEAAEEAFTQVNSALANCDDKVTQNTLGVTMYGTMWEDMGAEAVAALSDTNGAIDKAKDTMESIKEIKYDDFGSAFEGIGRQLETGLIIPLGEKLLPYVNEFANWLNEHMPEIIAVIESVISVIGRVIDTVAEVIGGIISYFTDFETKNSEVSDTVKTIWNEISKFFSDTFEALKGIVSTFLDAIKAFWDKWGETIKTVVSGIWEAIKIIFDTAFKAIQDIFNIFAAAFQGDWGAVWEGVKQLAADIWDGIKSLLQTWLNTLVQTIKNISSAMLNTGKEIFNSLWNGIKNVWQSLTTWLKQAVQGPVNTVKGIGSAMFNAGKSIFNNLWNGVKNVWSSIQSWVSDKVSWIKDKVTFWNNSNSSMKTDGSHAGGINEVPYDGYIAELHKGERVLTASENNALNARETTSSGTQINIVMNYPQVDSLKNIKLISRQLKEQISQGDRALGLV